MSFGFNNFLAVKNELIDILDFLFHLYTMKKNVIYFALGLITTGVISCQEKEKTPVANQEVPAAKNQEMIKSVLTIEEQTAMSPDEIIARLQEGNDNFVTNSLTKRDHSEQRRLSTIGQYPKALVLSSVDSRVPVEDVFDLGIGDIFVARVVGNIENREIVGSMEFATAVARSKVVIVMGHTACGAVKHAIDGTDAAAMDMKVLDALLKQIHPVVKATPSTGEMTSKNIDFTNRVIENNALQTVEDIKTTSPKLASLVNENKIKIIAAIYDMETGHVKFL